MIKSNSNDFEEFQKLNKELAENNILFNLTNGRGNLTETKRDLIMSGYSKILSFISRSGCYNSSKS